MYYVGFTKTSYTITHGKIRVLDLQVMFSGSNSLRKTVKYMNEYGVNADSERTFNFQI